MYTYSGNRIRLRLEMSTNFDVIEVNNEYSYHKPVMLEECLDSFVVRDGGLYVDCTLGGGGHTKGTLGILRHKFFLSDLPSNKLYYKGEVRSLDLTRTSMP